jgi:hypothetical protein
MKAKIKNKYTKKIYQNRYTKIDILEQSKLKRPIWANEFPKKRANIGLCDRPKLQDVCVFGCEQALSLQ